MGKVNRARALAAALGALGALCAAPARAADAPPLAGDRPNGQALFRLHCAGCHGDGSVAQDPTPLGRSLGAPHLRDPAFLAARSDDDLIAAVLKGGPGRGSPAFGKWLSLLDAGDLAATLRTGVPAVPDVFPSAAAYTGHRYTLPGAALARAETLAGSELEGDDRTLVLFSVYGGEQPPLGPRVVPDEPLQLDQLSPKAKIGYLAFGTLTGNSGAPVPYALGLDRDFVVVRLVGGPGGPDLARVAPAVVGKGGRDSGKRKPFASKAAPQEAAAITRLYARAVEAAALAAKEETDRHLFDVPDAPPRAAAREK